MYSAFRKAARCLAASLALLAAAPAVRADVIDDSETLQSVFDDALLDVHGDRWNAGLNQTADQGRQAFAPDLTDAEAKALWAQDGIHGNSAVLTAQSLGLFQARTQHVAALQMLATQRAGDVEAAREWRSIIKLPKYANAVDGALALQRLGGDATHRDEVSRLLAKEYVVWQITRAREKADALMRLIQEGRATPSLIHARAAEIEELSSVPPSLLEWATGSKTSPVKRGTGREFQELLAGSQSGGDLAALAGTWRLSLESGYPNLLSEADVERRERIVLKLLRLIPMEYQSGVRDGEISVPLEYREAKSFTIQSQQIINELLPVWRKTKAEALGKHGQELLDGLENLETAIGKKAALAEVEGEVKKASGILQSDFGLTLKRAGTSGDVVTETALEIRGLLGQSLAAAQAGDWRKAAQFRLDAYVDFDLEIESRTLPRDPTLALRAEKAFLDGDHRGPGIKAALDSNARGEELEAAYQRALADLDECTALIKVGLSPMAAALGAVLIISREGLEAVVILAALLAGLRGAENAGTRRQIGMGAWLAIGASILLFMASRTLLQGFSRYGETLEAVISIVAVGILLMVTNWVFHKYYWTGWNSRLRDLSKAAQKQQETRWEHLALVGVGFMTIFREGFETTLFMQSLVLEAGMKPVLAGMAVGGGIIGLLGGAVFLIGAKLPYRRMLMFTGVLVIFVLFTFLGSTVRLFQTVGWLPVHPIPGLELPAWTGVWLGIYPTWEGLLIPFGAFAYVGGMWLWVKIMARRAESKERAQQRHSHPAMA